eukprot:SAG22_NODE_3441_length_1709_cov_1.365839_1_plen_133_part_10
MIWAVRAAVLLPFITLLIGDRRGCRTGVTAMCTIAVSDEIDGLYYDGEYVGDQLYGGLDPNGGGFPSDLGYGTPYPRAGGRLTFTPTECGVLVVQVRQWGPGPRRGAFALYCRSENPLWNFGLTPANAGDLVR